MATKTKKPKKELGKAIHGTHALHLEHKDGEHHAVAVLNLHVLIVPDEKYWFAQGLEIDYAAQGTSVADVKDKFETGFRATIHHNLKIFGHIKNMLHVAPNDVWLEFLNTPKAQKTFSHASMHSVVPGLADSHSDVFQYEQIEYAEIKAAGVGA